MQEWMRAVLTAPPKGYPETINVPGYFLQMLDTPGWEAFFRILLLALLVIVVAGCFYYEKHPAKPRKKRNKKQEKAARGAAHETGKDEPDGKKEEKE